MSDPLARLQALYAPLSPEERNKLQPIVDLAIELARPRIMMEELERLRTQDPVLRRHNLRVPLTTHDETADRLRREFDDILGEFYARSLVPGAIHAEVSVAFVKGDAPDDSEDAR